MTPPPTRPARTAPGGAVREAVARLNALARTHHKVARPPWYRRWYRWALAPWRKP